MRRHNEVKIYRGGKRTETHDGKIYPWYVLGVLVLVCVLNFIDRQILSILAEDIKADIGLTDSQIGFLYGTAFALFYAVFGIPLGRLADVWIRKNIIAVGLFLWSAMTALSSTARSFFGLGAFRIGVGVGEASASPAVFSLLADYFPRHRLATVLSIYCSGAYIGSGLGMLLGGWVVDAWNGAFAKGQAPLDLSAWQAAFIIAGLPGILVAVWVWTLREPVRGQSEGIASRVAHPQPFREFFHELSSVVPPLTLWRFVRVGGDLRGIGANLAAACGFGFSAWVLVVWLGNPEQWISLASGFYIAFSWSQILALRDRPAYDMIFRGRALRYATIGFALMGSVAYGVGFWLPPFFIRVHGTSPGQAGLFIGLSLAVGGTIGVTFGGVLSDALKRRTGKARFYTGLLSILLTAPVTLLMLTMKNTYAAYGLCFLFWIVSSLWTGMGPTTVAELVLPRMRGVASSIYVFTLTLLGLALGPYSIGKISDFLTAGGKDAGEALRSGMMIALLVLVLAVLFLVLGMHHIERDEEGLAERAKAAGEDGLA
jgi:MFS family permease